MSRKDLVAELVRAASSKDPVRVEEAVREAYALGLSPDLVPAFVELLAERWHTRHEDLALALQRLKDPRAVVSLEAAAIEAHEYLEYDEFYGLARKCTWALADIGTDEALSALVRLAGNSNLVIASYAQKRIESWHKELSRKGA